LYLNLCGISLFDPFQILLPEKQRIQRMNLVLKIISAKSEKN